jgi:type IV secretion system protein VirD4
MVKQSIRWFSTGLFTILVYLVTSSVLGAISAVLHHIRSFRFSDLVVVKTHLITLRYSWSAIVHPNPITDFAFLMTGLFFLWDGFRTFRIAYDQRRKYKIRDKYASHGTARWQTRSEVQAFYEKDNRGYLLGDFKKTTYQPLSLTAFNNAKIDSYAVHPFTSELNQQYVIFGPPGSKKTTGYILPNLFHLGQQGLSIVATDPKGELYQHTGEYLRELGYNVVVLDYIHFQYGSRQNYLQYIFEEKQYAELASMFLNATRNEGDKRDFWEGKAQELLTALIGFVHQAYGDKGTFTDIYNLLGLVLGDRDHMLRLLDQHNVKGAPKLLLKSIIAQAGSENLMSNIVGTLTEKLNLFTLSNVRGHTATTDYDLNRIAKEKTAVFVFIDVADVTYAPLVSVF